MYDMRTKISHIIYECSNKVSENIIIHVLHINYRSFSISSDIYINEVII